MDPVFYPGSFDPITYGHLDIIERTVKVFGFVHIVIMDNPKKNALFTVDERIELAKKLNLADHVFKPGDGTLDEILEITGGNGVEKAIDCSANEAGRTLAIRATRAWGKIAFVGEGGTARFNPSPDIIHGQKTIYGSWVTSLWRMEELVERIVRWGIHPEDLITHRFTLDDADKAFALMADGRCGKVAVVYDGTEDQ